MSEKIDIKHEHETTVAIYCGVNNLEINHANIYDLILRAFRDNPVIMKTTNPGTGEVKETDVTARVARYFERQPKTVERIADKALLMAEKHKQWTWQDNIEKSKGVSVPNLDKLVENLYKLNIVDGSSYLALVCFLMQLRHSRDSEVPENDKTCVFFNGVARNGKSFTAKAIFDVESQYGEVYCVKSGRILESTHEERVWKSHLNYFDEVKPSDIDRELLLLIINGGEQQINPKNKRQYIQKVNTNNIFTSNDQISLKQRRVSVVKFGNRLNGRPLESGTLKNVVSAVMESLPNLDRYYEIYDVVSVANENRINSLAIESIITFLTKKLSFVQRCYPHTLEASCIFAPRQIYNCIKGTYNKQIIVSERKEAIVTALEDFVEKGLMERVFYKDCTTKNYKVTGANYLGIMELFDQTNTRDEDNERITIDELRALLLPYFIAPVEDGDKSEEKDEQSPKKEGKEVNTDWIREVNEDRKYDNNKPDKPSAWIPSVPEDIYQMGRVVSE